MGISIEFVRGNLPEVKPGGMRLFIVAGISPEGRELCYPAYYLNEYPLQYDEDCDVRGCTHPENDDGCPTTGWFTDESNFEYENCYHTINGEVVAYAEWPDRLAVHAFLQTP